MEVKKMRKQRIISIVLIVLLLFVSTAYADDSMSGRRNRGYNGTASNYVNSGLIYRPTGSYPWRNVEDQSTYCSHSKYHITFLDSVGQSLCAGNRNALSYQSWTVYSNASGIYVQLSPYSGNGTTTMKGRFYGSYYA